MWKRTTKLRRSNFPKQSSSNSRRHFLSAGDSQGHHPDIFLAWGKVKLTIWTHKIDGLTESDFILAAKVDELPGTG